MQENMIHTPEAHIPIAGVSADHGVVYLQFKKSKTNVYETITLDKFLCLIYEVLYGIRSEDIDSRHYYK